MKNERSPEEAAKRRDLVNTAIWIFIGVMFALTAVWVYWASRQPRVRGIFSPDDE